MSTVVQWVKLLPAILDSIRAQVWIPPATLPIQLLLVCMRKQQRMAWEIQIEILALGVGLVQPQVSWPFGKWTKGWKISFSLFLSITLLFKQNQEMESSQIYNNKDLISEAQNVECSKEPITQTLKQMNNTGNQCGREFLWIKKLRTQQTNLWIFSGLGIKESNY